jgi:predicted porin
MTTRTPQQINLPISAKSLLMGAALTALAGLAAAQSTVSLTGVVDVAARRTINSAGSITSLVSGSNSTSRLQFSGNEDLGGGMTAGFWLEGSMNADTGTGGTGGGLVFDRRSTVSLASKKWGEVRLGRDWTPVFWGFAYSDPFVFVGVGSMGTFFNASVSSVFSRAFGSAVSPTTISRSSNAIEYHLPSDLGGVNGQFMYAPGENGNAAGNFKYGAGRLGYKAGGFDGSVYAGSTHIDAAGANLKMVGAYGSYKLDVVRLSTSFTSSSYLSSKQNNIVVGAVVPLGQYLLKASYNRADQQGTNAAGASIDANDAGMFAFGVDYFLSKRTAIYGNLASLNNKGAANFAVTGGPAVGVTGGSSSKGVEIGIRHSF